MRPIHTILALFLSFGALTACQTVEGAGEDIQSAGVAIQQESNEVQSGM